MPILHIHLQTVCTMHTLTLHIVIMFDVMCRKLTRQYIMKVRILSKFIDIQTACTLVHVIKLHFWCPISLMKYLPQIKRSVYMYSTYHIPVHVYLAVAIIYMYMYMYIFLWPVGPSLWLFSHGFDVCLYIYIFSCVTYASIRCIRS